MGYDLERFNEDATEFQCPICTNVLEDPLETSTCHHIFCRMCITEWIKQTSVCPIDRRPLQILNLIKPSFFFRNLHNSLKARCNFSVTGCAEILKIEHLVKHEITCAFNFQHRKKVFDIEPYTSNEHKMLIESLKRNGVLKSMRVEYAMKAVDRCLFLTLHTYEDHAQSIGYGSTINAPHMHATILELLTSNLTPGAKALDIGSGSGYLTICMALMLGEGGKVIGIDHVKNLVDRSTNVVQQHFGHLAKSRILFETADGMNGYMAKAPYDVIHVGGVMKQVPQLIINQLKNNGRIVIPLICAGGPKIVTIDKSSSGKIIKTFHMPVKCQPIQPLRLQNLRGIK